MDDTPHIAEGQTPECYRIEFGKALVSLLNQECQENESDTPDFILAKYMLACLDAFDTATNTRDTWYGVQHFKKGCDQLANADDVDLEI